MTDNYLFKICNELFTVCVNNVLNVPEKQKNRPVSIDPKFVLGITDSRGEVVPVIVSWANLNFHVIVPDSSNEQQFYSAAQR